MGQTKDIVICGAGIAGISAAYFLAVRQGLHNVLLVDERDPLCLTSDKSNECYRNWWPGPGDDMVAFMNRSIDLLEELADLSGNAFNLNRRGYLYVTADPRKILEMQAAAESTSSMGGGELRVHRGKPDDPGYLPAIDQGFRDQPGGADLFLDPGLIRGWFPYLSEQVVAALHIRRAGWLSAQQLGMYLLEQARLSGVQLVRARVEAVEVTDGRVQAVRLSDGQRIQTGSFVNAAGPFIKKVGAMIGVDLPVFTELHQKVAFRDSLGVISRHAPLLIWMDSQCLPWSDEEQSWLAKDEGLRFLLDEFPSGAHTRPEGGIDSQIALLLWEYRTEKIEPVFPIALDPHFPEIVLRGHAAMLPGIRAYFEKPPRPTLDGGYYTKTVENRPLIGPLPVQGAYLIGALSGYGVMSACAAGELLAAHLAGSTLPSYAPAFNLRRYQDAGYQRLLEQWTSSGQL
jgi:sarcosine oxidase, subunit beta